MYYVNFTGKTKLHIISTQTMLKYPIPAQFYQRMYDKWITMFKQQHNSLKPILMQKESLISINTSYWKSLVINCKCKSTQEMRMKVVLGSILNNPLKSWMYWYDFQTLRMIFMLWNSVPAGLSIKPVLLSENNRLFFLKCNNSSVK